MSSFPCFWIIGILTLILRYTYWDVLNQRRRRWNLIDYCIIKGNKYIVMFSYLTSPSLLNIAWIFPLANYHMFIHLLRLLLLTTWPLQRKLIMCMLFVSFREYISVLPQAKGTEKMKKLFSWPRKHWNRELISAHSAEYANLIKGF